MVSDRAQSLTTYKSKESSIMKKRTIIIFIVITALSLIGTGFMMQDSNKSDSKKSDKDSTTVSETEPNTVVIENFKFSTPNLNIQKGTTVTWKNLDTAKHDINFVDSGLTDSNLLEQNGTYSYKFDVEGEYSYSCTPHPFMKATITVTK